MTDHAAIVRAALSSPWRDGWRDAVAALDDLVAERDSLKLWNTTNRETAERLLAERDENYRCWNVAADRAKAAEARVTELRKWVADVSADLGRLHTMLKSEYDALVADRDAWIKAAADNGAAQDAAEAERDEAVAHLHGIVEADKQDAQMGHPNPGDSCIGIYISLVLMEWLETRAALAPKEESYSPFVPRGENYGT